MQLVDLPAALPCCATPPPSPVSPLCEEMELCGSGELGYVLRLDSLTPNLTLGSYWSPSPDPGNGAPQSGESYEEVIHRAERLFKRIRFSVAQQVCITTKKKRLRRAQAASSNSHARCFPWVGQLHCCAA